MRSLAVSLAKDGHTTVRFDFLGHGRNSTPFFGDITDINGPSTLFINQLNSVIDNYKKKYKNSDKKYLDDALMTSIAGISAAMKNTG